jgi:hypothetical protein
LPFIASVLKVCRVDLIHQVPTKILHGNLVPGHLPIALAM